MKHAKNRQPELLAPAGSQAMLETALAFGADAVYAGQPRYSLRVRVRNNSFRDEAAEEQEKAIHPKTENPHVRNRTSVIDFFRLIWLASLAMVSVGVLAAEAPQVVGKFVRSDGVAVSALEMDLGGVVGFTGYTCWFELSDGTKIYSPNLPYGKEGSCVVRTSRTGADVYSFPIRTRTFPVANRILRFDGHQFEHVETPWKYWASPVVHTAHYFLGYLIAALVFTPFLFVGDKLIHSAPWQGYRKLLRVFWVVLGLFIAYSYSALLSIYGPLALWISLSLLAIWTVLYWWRRKRIRNPGT